ncbi:MAG: integrin alpha, partial [Bacteroidota bacterium]
GLLSSLLSNLQMKTALYGFVVTSLGDVNGDGFGDVAISAPGLVDIFSGTGSMAAVGAVFVYYGTFSGLPATPSKTLQPNTAVEGALFGFSVDAGDVTGDGRNDIIIGAPMDKYTVHVQTALLGGPPLGTGPLYGNLEVKAGKVYVYKSEDLPSGSNPTSFLEIKLGNSFFSPGLLGVLGSNINVSALFGYSVAATDDLNGDSKADIVIGAPSYVGTNLLSVQNGNAFVYYSDNLGTTTPHNYKCRHLHYSG